MRLVAVPRGARLALAGWLAAVLLDAPIAGADFVRMGREDFGRWGDVVHVAGRYAAVCGIGEGCRVWVANGSNDSFTWGQAESWSLFRSISAPDGGEFGAAVHIIPHDDFPVIAIGDPSAGSGVVHVYSLDGGGDPQTLQGGSASSRFGAALSGLTLGSGERMIAVGAPSSSEAFLFSDGGAATFGTEPSATLDRSANPSVGSSSQFGSDVVLVEAGAGSVRIVVSAPVNPGKVVVFSGGGSYVGELTPLMGLARPSDGYGSPLAAVANGDNGALRVATGIPGSNCRVLLWDVAMSGAATAMMYTDLGGGGACDMSLALLDAGHLVAGWVAKSGASNGLRQWDLTSGCAMQYSSSACDFNTETIEFAPTSATGGIQFAALQERDNFGAVVAGSMVLPSSSGTGWQTQCQSLEEGPTGCLPLVVVASPWGGSGQPSEAILVAGGLTWTPGATPAPTRAPTPSTPAPTPANRPPPSPGPPVGGGGTDIIVVVVGSVVGIAIVAVAVLVYWRCNRGRRVGAGPRTPSAAGRKEGGSGAWPQRLDRSSSDISTTPGHRDDTVQDSLHTGSDVDPSMASTGKTSDIESQIRAPSPSRSHISSVSTGAERKSRVSDGHGSSGGHGSSDVQGSSGGRSSRPSCNMFLIPREEVRFLNRLGAGSFKTVFAAQWGGNAVAVSEVTADMISHEVSIMANLSRHPNLVQLYGLCEDKEKSKSYLVMELLPMGSLSGILHDRGEELSDVQRLTICSQIATGMAALAGEGIVHADLAARNVLVQRLDDMVNVKVADFGLSKVSSLYYGDTQKIPFRWCSPEVLRKGKWTEKSDVWAFGVTMWEVFTNGDVPYGLARDKMQIQELVAAGGMLERPRGCPDNAWEIMRSCWAFKDKDRPSFKELCSHIYGELPSMFPVDVRETTQSTEQSTFDWAALEDKERRKSRDETSVSLETIEGTF